MTVSEQREALITSSEKQLWCGCLDCSKLTTWRGDGSNRTLWKSLCTTCLLVEFCMFVRAVHPRPLMFLALVLSILKLQIETWGQDTPNWVCPGGSVVFLLVYAFGLPSITWACASCTGSADIVFPYRDAIGFLMFLFGSSYALWYEVYRFKWKADPANKGKLHTIGLAKYCVHPNYFGDLFTYSGLSICAGSMCALSGPAFMPWMFILIVNPNSDAYLANRYSDEWPAYASQTATLVPGIHSKFANRVLAWSSFVLSCFLGGSCASQCG